MNYTLQYGQVWPYIPFLLDGAVLSLQIAFLAFCGGLLLGTVFASLKTFGGKVINRVIDGYVTFFMNTPQLVTTLGQEKEVNTFFRLQNPEVIEQLRLRFPEIGASPDSKTVFLKLRELRNSW